jgi:hypothetical protein
VGNYWYYIIMKFAVLHSLIIIVKVAKSRERWARYM